MFPIKTEGLSFSDSATRDKISDHSNLKKLTTKQMFQRLPIALVQVKAGKISKNLLNEIR